MNKRKEQTTERATRNTHTERRDKRESATSQIVFLEDEGVYQVTCAGKTNKYGIGATVPKGSCAYKEERGTWTAKSLGDARQMAEDFASNILAGAKG